MYINYNLLEKCASIQYIWRLSIYIRFYEISFPFCQLQHRFTQSRIIQLNSTAFDRLEKKKEAKMLFFRKKSHILNNHFDYRRHSTALFNYADKITRNFIIKKTKCLVDLWFLRTLIIGFHLAR